MFYFYFCVFKLLDNVEQSGSGGSCFTSNKSATGTNWTGRFLNLKISLYAGEEKHLST